MTPEPMPNLAMKSTGTDRWEFDCNGSHFKVLGDFETAVRLATKIGNGEKLSILESVRVIKVTERI